MARAEEAWSKLQAEQTDPEFGHLTGQHRVGLDKGVIGELVEHNLELDVGVRTGGRVSGSQSSPGLIKDLGKAVGVIELPIGGSGGLGHVGSIQKGQPWIVPETPTTGKA
jgi:hypothetical protein